MKKMIIEIEGLEYALHYDRRLGAKHHTIIVEPLPLKQKTIVQVVAEAGCIEEYLYRSLYPQGVKIYDAIEQRLQALEKKMEGK